ncbi:MAG: hypothetical protein MUQ02_05045, partial [Paracoccaceae bacterium]|nr:hypothetical protein [Paracoccaceae bacterium]
CPSRSNPPIRRQLQRDGVQALSVSKEWPLMYLLFLKCVYLISLSPRADMLNTLFIILTK